MCCVIVNKWYSIAYTQIFVGISAEKPDDSLIYFRINKTRFWSGILEDQNRDTTLRFHIKTTFYTLKTPTKVSFDPQTQSMLLCFWMGHPDRQTEKAKMFFFHSRTSKNGAYTGATSFSRNVISLNRRFGEKKLPKVIWPNHRIGETS